MRVSRAGVGHLVAVTFGLGVLAGCGGGGHSSAGGVASVDGGKPTASASASTGGPDKDSAIAYARCMRANGVPDFPDPDTSNGGMRITLPNGADTDAVKAATDKCKQYLPNGGALDKPDPAVTEQLRRYAACMRQNGITGFPDPDANGGGLMMSQDSGIDPTDPKFKAADQTCSALRPQGTLRTAGPGGGA